MRNLNVGYDENVPLDSLIEHPENPNEGDVGAVVESIEANGWYGVIVADVESRTIVVGNHRKQALEADGETVGPVLWIRTDDPDHARRVLLADNRTNRLGFDNTQMVADLLVELTGTMQGLAGTGYDADDLDVLMKDLDSKFTPSIEPETATRRVLDGDVTAAEAEAAGRFTDIDDARQKRPLGVTCPNCGADFDVQ